MGADTITYLVSCSLIAVIVPLALVFFRMRAAEPSVKNVFRQSREMSIFAFIGLLIVGAVAVFVTYLSFTDDSIVLFGRILLAGFYYAFSISVLWMFLSSINYRLILDEEYMIYVNFLKVKKQYRYDEITKVIGYKDRHGNLTKYVISVGNKRIEINYFYGDLNAFLVLIKKRLRKSKNRVKIKYKISKI